MVPERKRDAGEGFIFKSSEIEYVEEETKCYVNTPFEFCAGQNPAPIGFCLDSTHGNEITLHVWGWRVKDLHFSQTTELCSSAGTLIFVIFQASSFFSGSSKAIARQMPFSRVTIIRLIVGVSHLFLLPSASFPGSCRMQEPRISPTRSQTAELSVVFSNHSSPLPPSCAEMIKKKSSN